MIGERTEHVFGRSEEHGGGGNPGPHTALGVYTASVRASRMRSARTTSQAAACSCKVRATLVRRSRHCCATQVLG